MYTCIRMIVFNVTEGPPQTGSSYMDEQYDIDIYGLAPDKMTYTEQANKRSHCKRLTWYT